MPKPLPPVRRSVPMEESMLLSMAQTESFRKEFPFLSRLQKYSSAGGCDTCSGNAKSIQKQADFERVKASIYAMDDTKRNALKKMLNATEVSVLVRSGNAIVRRKF